jgi:L-alanine-DL-glutamate epimerase-like enolase superfamily enzyme
MIDARPVRLELTTDAWEMVEPFSTTQDTVTHIETVTVTLSDGAASGRGEALGVDYHGEDAASMLTQIEAVRGEIESGIDRDALQALLPGGGARNAIDCALWDLEAKSGRCRAWELLGQLVKPVTSAYTLSLDSAEHMAAQARKKAHYPVLKLKLDEQGAAEKLAAIRAVRPEADLIIDGNGAWTTRGLETLADTLVAARVGMLEQPLPAGGDDALLGLDYPIILCADESCQDSADLDRMPGRYDMVNIKLDKCGGLTEALRMIQWCRDRELDLMVGNMLGSSLAMAPGFIVAQHCRYVDLDGPLWQKTDRDTPIRYDGAIMQAPDRKLWG